MLMIFLAQILVHVQTLSPHSNFQVHFLAAHVSFLPFQDQMKRVMSPYSTYQNVTYELRA